MNINPELKRNAWLELSAHRMLAMPAILALIFNLAYLTAGNDFWKQMGIYAVISYVALVVLWGGKLASEGLIREVDGQTWDNQRMSVIGPWSMSWGKLFGSTLFPWYGGVICLAVYLFARLQTGYSEEAVKVAAILLLVGVLAQSVGLLGALLLARKRGKGGSRRYTGLYLFAILGVLWLLPLLQHAGSQSQVDWFGYHYPIIDFVLLSLMAWAGWALIGIYRVMRVELQFTNTPWVWLLFVTFLLVFLSGFVPGGGRDPQLIALSRLLVSFAVASLLLYFLLFSESKDVVALRRLFINLRSGSMKTAAENLPLWLLTLMVVAGLATALLFELPFRSVFMDRNVISQWFPLAALLFMVRDAALLLALNMSLRTRWADGAALVYLLVLYGLLPAVINLAGWSGGRSLFYPLPGGDVSSLIAPAVEMVAMLVFVRMRMARLSVES
ncbi:hypothetical protein BOW53_16025 [Solemya pervernicosa gill symbiont]|uniref:Uncharacterized protein n=2 Tax=Gammaproteobacteria incertae sedis TaxID=118884 RepID=A0A1T2KZM4_9GAMM|nr:hypothetical protein [Candidatus Reidiella endopervernicosa]OOZ38298.1 hypothetical protein BOW53_16025 [Solemya pervernicosa gill symbiont]QKQ26007.1 hypothetical protein HUE57_06700 [Candidatus Reidiella endopervernicosa]